MCADVDDVRSSPKGFPQGQATAVDGVGRVTRQGGRVSDRVYDSLVDAIRSLRIPPGTPISEQDLARQLGVSRTPLREALARLTDIGLVEVIPQVSSCIARISLQDVRVAWFVRESLELAAIETICRQEFPDVSKLRAAIENQRASCIAGDLDAFFDADEALHAGIFDLSGYGGAWRVVVRSKIQLDRLRRLSVPDIRVVSELIDEHEALANSLEVKDLADAIKYLQVHARRVLIMEPALRKQYPTYFRDSSATKYP